MVSLTGKTTTMHHAPHHQSGRALLFATYPKNIGPPLKNIM